MLSPIQVQHNTVQYANSVYIASNSLYKSQLEKNSAHNKIASIHVQRWESEREESATSYISSHVVVVMCLPIVTDYFNSAGLWT